MRNAVFVLALMAAAPAMAALAFATLIDAIAPQASVFSCSCPGYGYGYGKRQDAGAPRDGLLIVAADYPMQTASPEVVGQARQDIIVAQRN
ncbi:MAG: hypothetical protein K2P77_00510 [Burkholderiaceae bacterium]|nr:hypothetical protein [Burkholderiaceae bacterium]